MKRPVYSSAVPRAIGPYSQAVQDGEWLFLSGQIPLDPRSGEIVEGGVRAQTERVLRNIQAILKEAGLGLEHILKTTVYLRDLSQFGPMNEVYGSFFKEPFPARATIGVSNLPKGAAIEIEAVARMSARGEHREEA